MVDDVANTGTLCGGWRGEQWYAIWWVMWRAISARPYSVFNAQEFRGMQLATINCSMAGEDCLVLMPTGRGGVSFGSLTPPR